MMPPTDHTRVSFLRLLPFWLLLAVYLSLPIGLTPDWGDTNVLSRLYLTNALNQRGSVNITPESVKIMALDDSVVINKKFYSNKAPGSSYWLWAVSKPVQVLLRPDRSPTIAELAFYGRILALIVPFLIFLNGLGRYLERRTGDPVAAWLAVGALAIGTNAAVYAMGYYGHVLAAVLIGWAWIRGSSDPGHRFVDGLLLAAAVAVEYNAAPIAAIMALRSVLLCEKNSRIAAVLMLTAGAFIPAAALGAYHQSITGNPFIPPFHYDRVWRQHFPEQAGSLFGMSLPSLSGLTAQWVLPSRGILFYSPWLAVPLIWAAWHAARASRTDLVRRDVRWCLAAVCLYAFMMSSYLGWQIGFSTGMRLYIVLLPVMTVLTAYVLSASSRPLKAVWLALATLSVVVFAVLGTSFPVHDTPNGQFGYNMAVVMTFPLWEAGRSQLLWPHLTGAGFEEGKRLMLALPVAAWLALIWTLFAPPIRPGRDGLRRWAAFGTGLTALMVVSAALFAGWLQIGRDPAGHTADAVPYWSKFLYEPQADPEFNPFEQGLWSKSQKLRYPPQTGRQPDGSSGSGAVGRGSDGGSGGAGNGDGS